MDRVSLWQQTSHLRLPTISPPPRTQAVIVGGGLCGLLTAYHLLQRGVSDLLVVDAGEIAGGVTAHTTAKITAQHGLCYQQIRRQRGDDTAALYAKAAKDAEAAYPRLMRDLSIDAGYTPCPAALYATDSMGQQQLEQEAEALSRLNLPFTFDRRADLPFPVTAALHTTGGGWFHPLQFAHQLAEHLQKQGVILCPRTTATDLTDDGVATTRGIIRADVAVMASHFPFRDLPGRYFMRMWQERSYVIAAAQVTPPAEMYWGVGTGDPSLRPFGDGVLIGGGNHRTGVSKHPHPLRQLAGQTAGWYTGRRIVAAWSAQDGMTPDAVPFIGRYPQADQKHLRVYVATGFNKWGMTGSMTAAAILAGAITGAEPVYAPVFSPSRLVANRKDFYIANAHMVQHLVGGHLQMPPEALSALRAGEGRLLTIEGKKVGAYKHRNGRLFLVKPVCTHMGCILSWNAEESSWDCPCHGSRFDYRGRPLNTPAVKPLARYKWK